MDLEISLLSFVNTGNESRKFIFFLSSSYHFISYPILFTSFF